jgi:glutathione S-transferase
MLELIQLPWSPYCCVQRRILEFSGARFKIINIPAPDRSLVWKLSRQRYYQVPILKDGRTVVFETGSNSQVISKYLESKLRLGLFPAEFEGVQDLLWRFLENEVEECTFKLNDIYFREFVRPKDQLAHLRWKERKLGAGCIQQWRDRQPELLAELEVRLAPFEQMLATRRYLLASRPLFVDFDLWGMLANFLFSGHYKISRELPNVAGWYNRMTNVSFAQL